MTSIATSSATKNFKKSRKVDEVKEVCQNRPEADILKVLEVFDNDVAKTIDAFMTDGGKEALSKWASLKRNTQESSNIQKKLQNGKKKPINNSAKGNSQSKNSSNINDLVSSIINQSINTTIPEEVSKPNRAPSSEGSLSAQLQHQQNILNSLNNLILNGQSKAAPVQISVVEKKESVKQIPVSVTSLPPSLSTTSVSSVNPASHSKPIIPRELNTNKEMILDKPNSPPSLPFHALNSHINLNYTNPNNTRSSLDKHYKDLQQQSSHLSKVASRFQDDLNKAQIACNQSFMVLRNIIDQRQMELQAQLNTISRQGNRTLIERQHKASQLRTLLENAVHLNDEDTLELKADIKHFVNERQVDDEFLRLEIFRPVNQEHLYDAVRSYGEIASLDAVKYASQRPSKGKLFNNMVKADQQKTTITNGIKHSIKITEVNGISDEDNVGDSEAGFIEVKKPQRSKNKPALNENHPSSVAPSKILNQKFPEASQNGVINDNHASAKSNGQPAKKKKQPKKKEQVNSTAPVSKANMNPFSLIANGHIN